MKRLNIEYTNYQESLITKAKRNKNLYKLIVPFVQIFYSIYFAIFKVVKSRVVFYNSKYFTDFLRKIYRNGYFIDDVKFLDDRQINIIKSYSLKVPSIEYLNVYYTKSTSIDGMKEFIFYDAFLKRCVELYYEDNFCVSLKNFLEIKIFDINNQFSEDGLIANIPTTFTVMISLKSLNNDNVRRIIEDRYFINYIEDIFKTEFAFYKLNGISVY